MHECILCGKSFLDTYKHSEVDKAHRNRFQALIPGSLCFCGGKVEATGHGLPDGGATWEYKCGKCNFLISED